MPCYEVRLITTEFKIKNKDVLKSILQNLGVLVLERGNIFNLSGRINGTIDFINQKAEIDNPSLINKVKRLYAEKIIQEVAAKKRWIFQKESNKIQLKRY